MTIESQPWYVHHHRVNKDYIKIENLQQWLVTDVPNINPNHPKYIDFWSRQTKKCIEGMWGNEFGKHRYMPGNLYFFGNYGIIEHSWEDERGVKITEDIKPFIVDFIWDYAYQSWVCRGFSGFEKDEEYSCNIKLKAYYEDKIALSDLPRTCIHNGQPKKYEDAFEYLRRLHNKKLGKSLFQNPTINYSTIGTRGSAKSYWSAIGELEYNFVFASAQRYDEKYINNEYKCEQCAGAHEVTKSAEMVAKFAYSQKCKTDESKEKFRNWFGIWVEQDFRGEKTIIPSPFYKHYIGNLECPNKENKYTATLRQKINGKWVDNIETSSIAHVNYSDKKLGGERAAEGGRYMYSVVEECGSCFTKGTKVMMWDLSEKNVEDIKIGDLLLGLNGTCNPVINTMSGTDEMYKINQKNGNDYIVNSKHILCLEQHCNTKSYPDDGYKEYTTENYISLPKYKKKTTYGLKAEIDFPKRELLLDPYWLGLWLGDGVVKSAGVIVNITKDFEVEDWLTLYIASFGYNKSRTRVSKHSNDILFTITPTQNSRKPNYFRQVLKNYNIFNEKNIPVDYLMSDRKDRLKLLAGLIDSDGSIAYPNTNKQVYEIGITNRPKLAKDVMFLARSLGFRVSCYEKHSNSGYRKKLNKYSWVQRLRISGNIWEIPVKIERKKTTETKYLKNHKCCSITVDSIGKGEYFGFTLQNSPYFILPDMTLVHNCSNLVAIIGANEGTLTRGGVRIGYQAIQGTSGNLISVQSTKKIFLNPRDYNILPHRNTATTDGTNGETGYFVPYHITLFQFKDKNGNTDFEKALQYVNDEREKLSHSKDPKVLRDFMMNKPCYIHEMWITDSGFYLPYEEAAERERELMKGQMYKTLGTPVIFKWDEKVPKGVSYDVAHNIEPIYDFPIPKELKDPSGCVVIYEQPIDNPPNDFYLYCCDPYVEEDIDKGGSLAVTYVIKNPKYIALGHVGNFIVASYIGKPSKGLSYYYEQQEKLIQYYGNFPQSFWYDARGGGETLRDYYIRKGKQYILCLRPNYSKGDSMYEKHTTTHGVVIGNKDSKKTVLKLCNDKLLETNVCLINGEEVIKRNIFRIPCIFLIRQIMQYNMDENFDAVSAFYIGIMGLNEKEARTEQALKQQRKVNIFENMLKDSRIFKQYQ